MGNTLPLPCVCYGANDETVITVGAGRSSRKKKTVHTRSRNDRAAARHVVPVDMPEELGAGEDEGEGFKAAWPGFRAEPGGGGDDSSGGVRVKIVVKRKEVQELVARLDRDAAERKTRMEELNSELGDGGAAVTMSPCRDAWRLRLASIPEN